MQMDAIEQKEIRGLSVKSAFTILVSTVTICGTVMATYFSLTSKIDKYNDARENDKTIYNFRLQSLESQANANTILIQSLTQKVSEIERKQVLK